MIRLVVVPQSFYWFQVLKFPETVITQLEQSIMNFLWKGHVDKSSTLQVPWKIICKLKHNCGLGLMSLSAWNDGYREVDWGAILGSQISMGDLVGM